MLDFIDHTQRDHVAPFAGAWIEMFNLALPIKTLIVAPFAGAWIEI